jgi:hypothetical protein
MLDLVVPMAPEDVKLVDVPVGHLEHADDLVLLSTWKRALQEKVMPFSAGVNVR